MSYDKEKVGRCFKRLRGEEEQERLALIYEWVKGGHIDLSEFKILVISTIPEVIEL